MTTAAEPFGVSNLVLSGTLRVLSHPRVFVPPGPAALARACAAAIRATPNAVVVAPAARGTGIGRHLMDTVVAEATRASVKGVELTTGASNRTARSRYESLNFRTDDAFLAYYRSIG